MKSKLPTVNRAVSYVGRFLVPARATCICLVATITAVACSGEAPSSQESAPPTNDRGSDDENLSPNSVGSGFHLLGEKTKSGWGTMKVYISYVGWGITKAYIEAYCTYTPEHSEYYAGGVEAKAGGTLLADFDFTGAYLQAGRAYNLGYQSFAVLYNEAVSYTFDVVNRYDPFGGSFTGTITEGGLAKRSPSCPGAAQPCDSQIHCPSGTTCQSGCCEPPPRPTGQRLRNTASGGCLAAGNRLSEQPCSQAADQGWEELNGYIYSTSAKACAGVDVVSNPNASNNTELGPCGPISGYSPIRFESQCGGSYLWIAYNNGAGGAFNLCDNGVVGNGQPILLSDGPPPYTCGALRSCTWQVENF
jgi:hypothetical protein